MNATDESDGARASGGQPVRLVVRDDLDRSRLTVFFRLLLAIPHLIWLLLFSIVALLTVIATWFAAIGLGRPPKPLHGLLCAYIRYATHLNAYLWLAADPYPGFEGEPGSYPLDLTLPEAAPQPRWSVALRLPLAIPALLVALTLGGAGQNRLPIGSGRAGAFAGGGALVTVAALLGWFASLARGRMPRGLRHLVWLVLWSILAVLAAIANWLLTLVRGRPPGVLHRFLGRYVHYQLHVSAFLYLAANPFPGFTGLPSTYPLDLLLPEPARQNRWKTGFRIVLAVPAVLLSGALNSALGVSAFLTWFAALVRGRAPQGLHGLSAYALRYSAQLAAYLVLLTDAYPHASPLEGAAAPEDAAPPA